MAGMNELLKDRRVILAIVGALMLLMGAGLAIGLSSRGDKPKEPPPASQAGLVVETGQIDDGKLDPARPLRCFVAGQFVGEMTLAQCAKKNGVATGALDVGVDENGQLAAADQAGTTLTPLPPPVTGPEAAPVVNQPVPPPVAQNPAEAPQAARGPTGACWKYAGGEWKQIAGNVPMGACVQTLYNGTCQRPGGAAYGRWGEQTLRLVPGKVEVSGDNRSFRTLVEQGPGCSVPAG